MKGKEAVLASIDQIGKSLTAAAAAAVAQVNKVGAAVASGFGALNGYLLSWIHMGLQGTTAGESLGLSMQYLAQQIASLVLPAVRAITAGVQRLTEWFRSLTGDQQHAVGTALTFGLALFAVAVTLPKVIAGLQGMALALQLLTANPLVALVAGITAFLLATEQGRSSLGGVFEAFKPILSALKALWDAFRPIIDALANVIPPLVEALTPAFEAVAFVIRKIAEWVSAVVGFVRELLGYGEAVTPGLAGGASRPRGREREEVARQGGGFEDVRRAFNRFQEAAVRQDAGSIEARQLAVQQQIEQNTRPGGAREPVGGMVALGQAQLPPPPPLGP